MKIALHFFLIFFATTCNEDDAKSDCIDSQLINLDTVCTEEYDPVCGCDEVTYSNACYAERNGVLQFSKGPCITSSSSVAVKNN